MSNMFFWTVVIIVLSGVWSFHFQDKTMSDCWNAGIFCSNRSSCKFDLDKNNLTCFCVAGFKGDLCDEDRNECNIGSAPCKKRGVCHNSIGSFRCDCLPGWVGSHCERSDGSSQSVCLHGYTGVNCTEDFDECTQWVENPCEHGSTCINLPGNFSCRCVNGWEGRICNEDINECNLTPGLCHNGGNCTNIPGSYRCDCPNPYTGAACDDISTTVTTPPQSTTSTSERTTTYITSHVELMTSPYNGASWSQWTSWSNCDATCGNGRRSRTRSEIKPGQCSNKEREMIVCNLDPCHVNGGWSQWTNWGHCSVSCGIGFEKRQRNCSNPYPSDGGLPCQGDSTEDRPCFIKACADGLWGGWSAWGSCSATCLGGIQKRSRICNNPAPSQFGHDCEGNSEDIKQCGNRPCANTLSSRTVAFRARSLSSLSPAHGQTLVYTNSELNQGDGYDNTSGVFTAPFGGVYLFVVQTCADARHDFSLAIVKDGHEETSTELYFADGYTCYTTNALMTLQAGSLVWVESKTYSSGKVLFEDASHINMFQGTRIGV